MAMLHVNQTFESILDFKEALQNQAIVDNFDFRWKFSDSTHAKANYVHTPNCKFIVQCNYYAAKAVARVTILQANHNCTGNPTIARS